MSCRVRALVCSCLCLFASSGLSGCGAPGRAEAPHGIVLIVLDTLRADGLSTYGNPRRTSPVMDRLAEQGVRFDQTVSHAAWTLPGMAGLLTARYPSNRSFSEGRLQLSLVERFHDAGYATSAFTEGAYVSRHYGMSQGFDHFWEKEGAIRRGGETTPTKGGGIEVTFNAAIEWLHGAADAPFFLLIHTYEPHLPYTRRQYAERLASGTLSRTYEVFDARKVRSGEITTGETERKFVRALYDGGVRTADAQVGNLIRALAELDLSDRTVIVVTSDHGEDLGERDPRHLGLHQHHLYDELLLVPLILFDPRTEYPVRRVENQIRLVDVLPTLLEIGGIHPPSELDGRSLLPLMRGEETTDRTAIAMLRTKRQTLTAMRIDDKKVIVSHSKDRRSTQKVEFFNLAEDPEERENLSQQGDPEEFRLLSQLDSKIAEIVASEPLEVPEPEAAVREQLEALGYLEPDSQLNDSKHPRN